MAFHVLYAVLVLHLLQSPAKVWDVKNDNNAL